MKLGTGRTGRRGHLVEILSQVLDKLCKQLYPSCINENTCSCFNSIDPPPIKLKCYLKRIATFTGCSEESLIFSLIYIDRLITNYESRFMVTALNVHRLFLSSILVAVKFYDDHYYDNVFFSKVGGVSRKELNMLETEFLFLINFDLSVDRHVYARYSKRLMSCPTSLSCKGKPGGGIEKIAIKQVPSLPLNKSMSEPKISIQSNGEVVFHPEHLSLLSTKKSLSCDDMHIRNKQSHRSSNARDLENRPSKIHVQSKSSAQWRCSDVALFFKPYEMEPSKIQPSH